MIRLAVRCRPELAERVLADLLELVPGGVEGPEWYPDPPGREAEEGSGSGFVEYAVYGPPGEVPSVPDLEAAAADGLVEISSTEIPDDWADRWRDFHKPVSIAGGRLVVMPSWETAPLPAHPASNPDTPGSEAEEVAGIGSGEVAGIGSGEVSGICVLIDPGQAFGTGAHATTSLSLELLLELADAGEASGALVDLGTGSGVLAIAAAKLGWGPVSALDSEAAAVEATAENAAANGVEIGVRRHNLREQEPLWAPTIVANLTAPLLEEVAARLTEPPRTLVCSGLLASERERVESALAAAGLTVAERRVAGDWAALLARG